MIKKLLIALSLVAIIPFQNHAAQLHVVTEVLPPLQYINPQGIQAGFSHDIVTALLKESGLSYEISFFPWARAYKLAQYSKNTCVYSLARLPERERLFHWITPLLETNSVMFGLKKKGITLENIEQAKAYNVAVIRDDATHLMLKRLGFKEHQNLYIVENSTSLLKLLYSKSDIDLIVADDITFRYRAKVANLPVDSFSRLIAIPNTNLDFYFACQRDMEPQVIENLLSAKQRLKTKGVYEQIIHKWQPSFGAKPKIKL